MKVFTDENPAWLQWIAPERFNSEELYRIVTFFVFQSPCPGLSARGRTLQEYGWTRPWAKPYYLNRQMKQSSSNYELLYSASAYDKMSEALKKADLYENFPNDYSRERICIYDAKKNQFMSVFYHLRNAFAHCRLNMLDVDGECVFILEDVAPGRGQKKVSARMILRRSTLLNWIDLIEGGEKEYVRNQDADKR